MEDTRRESLLVLRRGKASQSTDYRNRQWASVSHDGIRSKFTVGGAKNYFIKMDALGLITGYNRPTTGCRSIAKHVKDGP
jgi:hypothetical protein